MALGPDDPLVIWAVSDGRAGIANQALGLAEAVARRLPAQVVSRQVRYHPLFDRWPSALKLAPRLMLARDSDAIIPPWPDIWIAAGRATLPLSRRMRRWSGGRTLVVQVQDPGGGLHAYDLVVPPRHDGLSGANVFPILGSPNRVTPQGLAAAVRAFADRIEPLPHPRVAVLIGGNSRAYRLSEERGQALADQIAGAVTAAGGSVLVSFSRRTPPEVRALMTAAFQRLPGWIWDEQGPNPYFAFLGAADHVLVTEDSTNMLTEAAATGKPVHRLAMDGGSAKFARLHADLEAQGASRPFDGRLEGWAYPPLDETGRAAEAVLAAYRRRKA